MINFCFIFSYLFSFERQKDSVERKRERDLDRMCIPFFFFFWSTSSMQVITRGEPDQTQELGNQSWSPLWVWNEPSYLKHHHCLPGSAFTGRGIQDPELLDSRQLSLNC